MDTVAEQLQADLDAAIANLTAVQKRCTELLEENRRLKAAIAAAVLPYEEMGIW